MKFKIHDVNLYLQSYMLKGNTKLRLLHYICFIYSTYVKCLRESRYPAHFADLI
jgi:hypothetical protein